MLPPEARPHIAAIYAFARTADDFADEGDRTPDERIALLDDWNRRLHNAARQEAPGVAAPQATSGSGPGGHELADPFIPLSRTIRECQLDPALFEDLLSAFRQDVRVGRYDTWTDLLDYARRSANPVGRLVLRVCGYRDEALDHLSDRVCTALQLANFWQDIERDWAKGRVYVPRDVMAAAGAAEEDLGRRRLTAEWRAALADVVSRTRAMFEEGRGVADLVHGRLRWELRATWLGGMRILDRLEGGGYDVFDHRPTIGRRDALPIAWRMITWRAATPASRR